MKGFLLILYTLKVLLQCLNSTSFWAGTDLFHWNKSFMRALKASRVCGLGESMESKDGWGQGILQAWI